MHADADKNVIDVGQLLLQFLLLKLSNISARNRETETR